MGNGEQGTPEATAGKSLVRRVGWGRGLLAILLLLAGLPTRFAVAGAAPPSAGVDPATIGALNGRDQVIEISPIRIALDAAGSAHPDRT